MDLNWGQDDETARQYGEQADTFRTCSFSGSFPIRKQDWAEDEGGPLDAVPLKEIKVNPYKIWNGLGFGIVISAANGKPQARTRKVETVLGARIAEQAAAGLVPVGA
jgi:hypothetical protein